MRDGSSPPSRYQPDDGVQPLELAQYLSEYLFSKTTGGLYARWDEGRGEGLWVYSRDGKAIFEPPAVDEVVFRETVRLRFRSVIFRLGSAAAAHPGDLCGVMHVGARPPDKEGAGRSRGASGGARRRYDIHASFDPAAGLWFKAAIIPVART